MTDREKQFPPERDTIPASSRRSTVALIGLFLLELIKVALMAAVTIWVIRHFFFKPFYVKGESMFPTYVQNEYLLIDEISYRFTEPRRGEVIVFRSPVNPSEFYLKRVIGLPGERVTVRDRKVIIYNDAHPQGLVLDEAYLSEETTGSITVSLGDDEYFLLGDNRDESFDSRQFGPIHRFDIIGRTWIRGWPPTRLTTFSAPAYNL